MTYEFCFDFPLMIQIERPAREVAERFRSESDALHHMENKQEGNLSHREESGFFENLKSPQRQRFRQMNRYPFSKASCSAAGEGWGEGRQG